MIILIIKLKFLFGKINFFSVWLGGENDMMFLDYL